MPVPDRQERVRQQRFYRQWIHTDQAKQVRAPLEYNTLLVYPKNFKLVRETFHQAYITAKLLELV